MNQTALITGASGGIGYELAKLFAKDHHNVVLVARGASKLAQFAEELQREFGISAKAVPLDLTAVPAPQFLFDQLQREGIALDILVNNAGYGVLGEFSKVPLEESLGQIQLNITALTHLTKLFRGAHDRTPFWQDHERGFHGGFSARSADGGLLRHESLRHLILRGAGQRIEWLGRHGDLPVSRTY